MNETMGQRDLVGDLSASVRKAGLHMGLYHSIFEWFHPLYLADKANNYTTSRYVDEVYLPQAKEINTLYKPDLIWSDGDWEANSSYWKSPELLAWLYNDAPNKDTVVVNDRWGSDNPPIGSGKHFGGYFSGGDRQQASAAMLTHKWEESPQAICRRRCLLMRGSESRSERWLVISRTLSRSTLCRGDTPGRTTWTCT